MLQRHYSTTGESNDPLPDAGAAPGPVLGEGAAEERVHARLPAAVRGVADPDRTCTQVKMAENTPPPPGTRLVWLSKVDTRVLTYILKSVTPKVPLWPFDFRTFFLTDFCENQTGIFRSLA